MITATLPVHDVDAQSLFDAVAHVTGKIIEVPPLPQRDPDLANELLLIVDVQEWTVDLVGELFEAAKGWVWAGESRVIRLLSSLQAFRIQRGPDVGDLLILMTGTEEEFERLRSLGVDVEVAE